MEYLVWDESSQYPEQAELDVRNGIIIAVYETWDVEGSGLHTCRSYHFPSRLVKMALFLFYLFAVGSFVNDYGPGVTLSINSSLTSWAGSLYAQILTARTSNALALLLQVGGHCFYPARGMLWFAITLLPRLSYFSS
jgi:hypothetical protein